MRKPRFLALLAAALGISALLGAASHAQTPKFPPTLPANSVYGRLGAGQAGPAQAIPFATLFANCPTATLTSTGCLTLSQTQTLPVAYNAQSYGWTCDSTDKSTQAQALINTVAAAGGGTIFFPACSNATITATGSGTNLTVTAVSGASIVPGMVIAGTGVSVAYNLPFTTIVSQTSGAAGGAGVYVTSQATTANGDGGLVGINTYRADSQLTIPTSTIGATGGVKTSPAIRFTGPGAGTNINGQDVGNNVAANAATLDLRYKGSSLAGVGYTSAGGSGYTSGTAQQTLTMSGGTCTTPPQWKVVVSGGVVQGGAQSVTPTHTNGSIQVVTPGLCSVIPSNPVSVTSSDGGTGATFNVYWDGAKLQALGAGAVEIDHLTIIDAGAQNSTALFQSTNPTVRIHDTQLFCTSDPNQDALVFGGMLGTGNISPPNQTIDSPFLGYGTHVENNLTDHCSRFAFFRTFANVARVTHNVANTYCSGDRFMEFITGQSQPHSGGYVADNYTEACHNLKYGFVIGPNWTNNFFIGNSVFDITFDASFVADYQELGGNNTILPGLGGAQQSGNTFFIGSGNQQSSDWIFGESNNVFSGAKFGMTLGSASYIAGSYGGNTWPKGQLTVFDISQQFAVTIGSDPTNSRTVIDSIGNSPSGGGAGNPLVLNPAGAPISFNQYANAASTGTTVNKLAKLTGAPSTAIVTATTDTRGAIGVVVAGAGTTGSASIASIGQASCVFDGATTAGDYVQISSSTAGDCHDAGANYPVSGQVLGRVLSTNGGGGTYTMTLTLGNGSDTLQPGTPTIGSGACGAGSNGVITSGDNQAGLITIGASATTTCTIAFSATLAVAPRACNITPANATAAAWGTTVARVSSISASQWVITGSALASAAYYYQCM